MTEWYVYMEWGVPLEVVLGRRRALTRLVLGRNPDRETLRLFTYYMEGGAPDLRSPFVYGRVVDSLFERSITRCIGPGTEV